MLVERGGKRRPVPPASPLAGPKLTFQAVGRAAIRREGRVREAAAGHGATAASAEKRMAGTDPSEVPLAKQRAVEGEDEVSSMSAGVKCGMNTGVVCADGDEETDDMEALPAAFKKNFRQELDEALPGMTGKALGKSLAPMQKKQKELAENQVQLKKEINMLRESQTQQSINMSKQIEALIAAVKTLTTDGAQMIAGQLPGSTGHVVQSGAGSAQSASVPVGGATSGGAAGQGNEEGQHRVLMKFATRQLRTAPEAVERAARSRMNYSGVAPTYSGKQSHTHLTLHFQTYGDAEAYTEKFRPTKIVDKEGKPVILSHKNRIDNRPPHVRRRGVALAPLHDELWYALSLGEKLELAHETTPTTHTLLYAVNETTDEVREACRAYWADDGEQCRVTRLCDFADFVATEVQDKANAAIVS